MKKNLIKILSLFLFLTLFNPVESKANGLSLIRDAEIEDFLSDLTKPIFKAANLNPDEIKIYIVNENSLNAFVAGGQNVFINTGLITKYSDPNVLIGVIAHETGHISGGHLARSSEDMSKAGNAMILSYILGITAAVTASPDAGMAMIMGGSHIAQRTALKFTRTQEEAADALAIKYLNATGNSAEGLMTILQTFHTEEKGYKGQIDEYAITHPISQKRINFIKANLRKGHKDNSNLQKRLERIIAKLNGFLADPDQVFKVYNGDDSNSKYARVIANYRSGKTKLALKTLDELIALNPEDGYLYDLKGQILSESGDEKNAIIAYNKAILLNPRNDLARIALATSIVNLDSGDKEIINFAIKNLITASENEKTDSRIFKTLARAYNQKGDKGMSYLALAQMSLLEEDIVKTKKYVKLARDNLAKNDKINLLILDDIEEFAKKIKKEKDK